MNNTSAAADSRSSQQSRKKEVLFHGIPASPGIAIGSVKVFGALQENTQEQDLTRTVPQEQVEDEVARFQRALRLTHEQIKDLQAQIKDSLDRSEASIFDAHLLIVDDKMLQDEVISLIRNQCQPADLAFHLTIQRYIAAMSAMQDQYLQERAADIRDVGKRVLSNLLGEVAGEGGGFADDTIVIAHDLSPSDTALLDRKKTLGFAVETGSKTSHSALLARSMKIPAVVGMRRLVERLLDGDRIIIDGYLGMVIIHPEAETIAFYEEKLARQERLFAELLKEKQKSAETSDGYRLMLAANLEGTDGLDVARESGADGVGLFRTEYLFLNKTAPDEETQFQVYRQIAEALNGAPVVIRTLDLGGDKLDMTLNAHKENNPFLGLRAIRLCMDKPALLETQMRAVLRAGACGNIKMMFPMISGEDELDSVLAMLARVKNSLEREHIAFDADMEIGIMIEIPSAALIAEKLAKKVDFFSIGSNDLVQYTLAVDRGNEKVAYLYDPMHPAVIDLIARSAKAAHEAGIWIGCCGEIAGDLRYVPLLIGLGIQELSMSAGSIVPARRLVRRLSMYEAEKLAKTALELRDPSRIMELSQNLIARIAPEVATLPLRLYFR